MIYVNVLISNNVKRLGVQGELLKSSVLLFIASLDQHKTLNQCQQTV